MGCFTFIKQTIICNKPKRKKIKKSKMNRATVAHSPKGVLEFYPEHMDPEEGSREIQLDDFSSVNQIFQRPRAIPSAPPEPSLLEDARVLAVEPLELRSYQYELAAPALDGKNTVIVAPTGSGKTWVATYIIKQHLVANRGNQLPPKVVLLVPTVPLVSQQSDVLKRYLRDQWRIGSFTGGDTDVPRGSIVKDNDITVTTPQCFINTLKDPDPIGNVDFRTISLLVLDECHHCDEKHPYMMAMLGYMDLKLESPETLPQIVGLTASLGVGKGNKLEEAKGHIIKMGAHLDSYEFSTVKANTEELDKTVTRPTDECVPVSSRHSENVFSRSVQAMMYEIEQSVQPDLSNVIGEVFGRNPPVRSSPPPNRELDAYCCWVNTWLGELPVLNDGLNKRDITASLQYLKILQVSLEMHAHLSIKQASEWLEQKISEKERKHATHEGVEVNLLRFWACLKRELAAISETIAAAPNPLLGELLRTLEAEFAANPESRGILFVKTRDLTQELKKILLDHPRLAYLKPEVITSINAQGEKGGQSEMEQKQGLINFRDGTCRLLIATTVAEEGLDIDKCNLVIKYNHVTNEIAMVQKRGRGRAVGSKSILLALKDGVAEKERINATREKLMEEAIKALQIDGSDSIRNEVIKVQEEELEAREIEKITANERRAKSSGNSYPLKCIKCNELICYSADVRRIQDAHYVMANPDVWDRTLTEPLGRATRNYFEMSVAGKLSCKKCREDLGNVLKYNKIFLPSLKATSFIVGALDGVSNLPRKKKWKKVEQDYFPVEKDVSRSELAAMHSKLTPDIVQRLDQYAT